MVSQVGKRIERVLAGDQDAAAWLFDAFAPELRRRLAGRYGGEPSDLDDLLQDTFLLLFQRGGGLLRRLLERDARSPLGEADLANFLWDQACGLASNRRRSRQRFQAIGRLVPLDDRDGARSGAPGATGGGAASSEAPPTAGSGSGSGAGERAAQRQALRRLAACLRRGSARVHLYFLMRYRDGLTPGEVARACGWSRKATYKLRGALDTALRSCIERLGLEDDLP